MIHRWVCLNSVFFSAASQAGTFVSVFFGVYHPLGGLRDWNTMESHPKGPKKWLSSTQHLSWSLVFGEVLFPLNKNQLTSVDVVLMGFVEMVFD